MGGAGLRLPRGGRDARRAGALAGGHPEPRRALRARAAGDLGDPPLLVGRGRTGAPRRGGAATSGSAPRSSSPSVGASGAGSGERAPARRGQRALARRRERAAFRGASERLFAGGSQAQHRGASERQFTRAAASPGSAARASVASPAAARGGSRRQRPALARAARRRPPVPAPTAGPERRSDADGPRLPGDRPARPPPLRPSPGGSDGDGGELALRGHHRHLPAAAAGLRGAAGRRHPYRVTVSLSAPLISMLTDDLLKERYAAHLDDLIELAGKELERTRPEPHYHRLAQLYLRPVPVAAPHVALPRRRPRARLPAAPGRGVHRGHHPSAPPGRI